MRAGLILEAPHIVFEIDDGGRTEAGYVGRTGDCVCRAIAIAADKDYEEVYNALNREAERERPRGGRRSHAARGVSTRTASRYLRSLGATWTPTMSVGSGCRVHLHRGELPATGRLILRLSRHFAAYIDGVLRDNHDCSRGGSRCVYGYWTMPS